MACFQHLSADKLSEIQQSSGIVVLFKHSTRCSISATALNRVYDFCSDAPEPVQAYLINVIQDRDTSNKIESLFGILHESPQLIVLNNGKPVSHFSHFAIAKKDLLLQIDKFKLLS